MSAQHALRQGERVLVHFPLVHFGAVVADAPSPLSTPRSAPRCALGKPLRKKCRASPVLLFKRAGRVVAGSVGIVRATVPFHGEHDALEPTKEGLRCCGCHCGGRKC